MLSVLNVLAVLGVQVSSATDLFGDYHVSGRWSEGYWWVWDSWATLNVIDDWVNATVVCAADECILRNRLRWTKNFVISFDPMYHGCVATILDDVALRPESESRSRTWIVVGCTKEGGRSRTGFTTGITAGTAIPCWARRLGRGMSVDRRVHS